MVMMEALVAMMVMVFSTCQGRSRPIRVLNRLTIVMSDSSHFVSDYQ